MLPTAYTHSKNYKNVVLPFMAYRNTDSQGGPQPWEHLINTYIWVVYII